MCGFIIELLPMQSVLCYKYYTFIVVRLNVLRLQINTGRLFCCYLASWRWCNFHPTPHSAQRMLETVSLSTFTVLATTQYDSKE